VKYSWSSTTWLQKGSMKNTQNEGAWTISALKKPFWGYTFFLITKNILPSQEEGCIPPSPTHTHTHPDRAVDFSTGEWGFPKWTGGVGSPPSGVGGRKSNIFCWSGGEILPRVKNCATKWSNMCPLPGGVGFEIESEFEKGRSRNLHPSRGIHPLLSHVHYNLSLIGGGATPGARGAFSRGFPPIKLS